ncbi:uncharacterized protein LOC131687073 [Topomyia yanbarensis]|uniref:uncharacterized protein LOC131687073 n=1 Tax=Topomyia yanbarensis TaxID=2498891 RepID=UPI00273CB289|nr:uncharacterized protein LOC131687073 [Topomyia yanbarensis]
MTHNNFTIVQSSFDDDETYLCTLPSTWVIRKGWNNGIPDKLSVIDGSDLCYWPKKASGYRLLEKAKKHPAIEIDDNLLAANRCKIKRSGFETYSEAHEEQKRMEVFSDTDEMELKIKMRKDSDVAELFSAIKQTGYSKATGNSQKSTELSSQVSFSEDIIDSSQADYICPVKPTGVVSSPEMIATVAPESCEKCQSLGKFEDKLHRMEKQLDQCVFLLSQANAKIDMLSSRKQSEVDKDVIELNNISVQPVKTLQDLEALEKKCKDESYIKSVILSMGNIHGKHRFTGQGWTVCLQVIDYFLDRKFMREVSWTGVSKTKSENGEAVTKIAFSKYEHFINLFYQVILHADEQFSLAACHNFFKQCIRNSKQRLEDIKRVRLSVARKRRIPGNVESTDDENIKPMDDQAVHNDISVHSNEQNDYFQVLAEEYLEEMIDEHEQNNVA